MKNGLLVTIPVSGDITVKEIDYTPELKELRAAIGGGWLQSIPDFPPLSSLPDYDVGPGFPAVAYADEEGRLKGLPENPRATVMWGYDKLVGPVVIVAGNSALLRDL